ncbi:hypothetical protein C8R45DRAFT_994277 [Mycena sanguinolenta]|nr:hypothetical protein C8R45DRAFT_994277 [Mycena sanguinolenta]
MWAGVLKSGRRSNQVAVQSIASLLFLSPFELSCTRSAASEPLEDLDACTAGSPRKPLDVARILHSIFGFVFRLQTALRLLIEIQCLSVTVTQDRALRLLHCFDAVSGFVLCLQTAGSQTIGCNFSQSDFRNPVLIAVAHGRARAPTIVPCSATSKKYELQSLY